MGDPIQPLAEEHSSALELLGENEDASAQTKSMKNHSENQGRFCHGYLSSNTLAPLTAQGTHVDHETLQRRADDVQIDGSYAGRST